MGAAISYMAYEPTPFYPSTDLSQTDPVPNHDFVVKYRLIDYVSAVPTAPVLIYASGSGESFEAAQHKCKDLSALYGVSCVAFDYPGLTSNTVSYEWSVFLQEAKYAAILAVYDHLIKRGRTDVFVWGRSMGASVAAYLASTHKLSGVVLEAPLASLMAYGTNGHQWFMDNVAPYMDAYETTAFACKGFFGVPTYVVALSEDTKVPPLVHADRVYAALINQNPRAYLREIRGKNHNDRISLMEYADAVPMDLFYPDSVVSPKESSSQ